MAYAFVVWKKTPSGVIKSIYTAQSNFAAHNLRRSILGSDTIRVSPIFKASDNPLGLYWGDS